MPSLCDPQGKQSENLQTNLGKISYSGFSARLIYPLYNLNYMSYLKKGSEADCDTICIHYLSIPQYTISWSKPFLRHSLYIFMTCRGSQGIDIHPASGKAYNLLTI